MSESEDRSKLDTQIMLKVGEPHAQEAHAVIEQALLQRLEAERQKKEELVIIFEGLEPMEPEVTADKTEIDIHAVQTVTREDMADLLKNLRTFKVLPGKGLGEIGNYEMRNEIGRGGYGVAYIAWDNNLRREVVIKIMSPSQDASEQNRIVRFFREMRITAKFNHRHIVSIYDAGQTGNPDAANRDLFYVMQYCRNGSVLANKTAIAKMSTSEKLTLMRENVIGVAEALELMHQKNFVHGDIKPENILIDERGDWKLADFGLAENFERAPEHGENVSGTPRFLAPEYAASATGRTTPKTDIYAFGVTLFEIFARGKFVPNKDTAVAIITGAAKSYDEKAFPAEKDYNIQRRLHAYLTPNLANLIYEMVQPDPEKRTKPNELVGKLRAALHADEALLAAKKAS